MGITVKKKLIMLIVTLVELLILYIPRGYALGGEGPMGNGTWGLSIDIYSENSTFQKYAKKAYGQSAYTNSGCAWFASARLGQLTGKDTPIWDGPSWYNDQYSKYGFSRGSSFPTSGKALACYSGSSPSGYGHVSVIEAVSGDSVLVSEGGVNGIDPKYDYCRITVKTKDQVINGASHPFLGFVYLLEDKTKPVVNSATIQSISKNGYTIAFTASDNVGINSIQFGTWNTNDGIDRAQWITIPGATSGSAYIDTTSFTTNTNTTFYTNVYAYDYAGNVSTARTTEAVYIEAVPPSVTSAKIQNITSTGYDVVCEGSDNKGVWKFLIGTWHDNMSIDDAKWQETVATNGKATFHVSIADFGNAINTTYHTNVYAFDICQNMSTSVRAGDPYITNNQHPVTGVSLNYSKARLNLGSKKTIQLRATVSPSNATIKTVTWKSSNTAVATVSNTGLVTPVAAGNATITVTTNDQNKTATCAITVVQSVDLGTNFWAEIGTTNSRLLTVESDNRIASRNAAHEENQFWYFTKNSDGTYNIASGGKMMTLEQDANGASVSVKAADGSLSQKWYLAANGNGYWFCSEMSYLQSLDASSNTADGVKVYVWENNTNIQQRFFVNRLTRVQSLTFSGAPIDKSNIRRADLNLSTKQTIALNPSIAPAGATYKDFTLTSSNPAVATVSTTGVVTPVAVGSAVITGTTKDGAKTASFSVSVRQSADLGTGFWAQISKPDGRVLTKETNGFSMQSRTLAENQFWYFTRNRDGSYCLSSEGQLLTMDADKYGSGVQGNTNLSAKPQNGSDGQKWFLYPHGDNYWIHSAMSYLQCVDVVNGDESDGAVVRSWESNNGAAERLDITKVTRVQSVVSNWDIKTLDVRDSGEKEIPISVQPSDATYPDLIWTNTNENVASIENGKITVKAEGKTQITATSRDGGFTVSSVILVADGQLADGGWMLPRDLRKIKSNAFTNAPVTVVRCPEGLLSIDEDAFLKCDSFRQIVIPSGVTAIDKDAFRDCGVVTIFGKEGSAAQQFAKQYEIPFFLIPD